MVKALDLRSNGRIVRVGSNPTPGNIFYPYILNLAALVNFLVILSCFFLFILIINTIPLTSRRHHCLQTLFLFKLICNE